MTLDTLLIYAVASLALALIPGPTMLLALSNGIAKPQGRSTCCSAPCSSCSTPA
jgi:threonine/homoserine/homoserine lactone efflux protein